MIVYVVTKIAARDIDVPGADIEEVRVYAKRKDAVAYVEKDFEKEEAEYSENDDARFLPFNGVSAAIESYQADVTMIEWLISEAGLR